ncbi:ribose transport system permease protein [Deinococcus metalli]|uniref:ABC transporter permease n=1 Tax=Deinococcus metalli TaxID=1141878 RepID=A0A7W8KFZ1_9DEIO|nr:ABC transporter permease [Deinococcus metalli]MBB5375839.1 ribose transport system permease protein [Deinococcus metalli]GHF36659.1 ABC transporter permease [Deinococcus metalli]
MSQPDPRAAGTTAVPARPPRPVLTRVASLGPLLGLIALMVAATLLNPDFLTVANLSNVLTRAAFSGIIAVGMTFVIISGGIDLSVGSMAALIAGSMILIMNALSVHLGPGLLTIALGMLAALAIGALAGLFHGTVITRGRIEPFIVTLGTLGIFRAVLTYLAQGGAISLDSGVGDRYGPVYYGSLLGVPVPILVFTAVALAGGVILNRTRYGRYVQAIGSSEQVARYAAINVTGIKILTYVLLGVCVGLATILYVPRLGSATPSTGLLWELEAIAAVIIGGTALRGGSGRIWGTVVGAVLLVTIENVLNLTNIISVYLNAAVTGFVIIGVAFFQRGRR